MNRIVKWFAAVLILAIATNFAPAQTVKSAKKANKIPLMTILGKAASKISRAEDMKWLADTLDEATMKESTVVAKAIERGFSEKARLVTGTVSVDVSVEGTTSYWRGSVTQQVIMPCTATLAVDLDKLLAKATFDPATKTIEFELPPLSIVAVESHNSKYTADPTYSGGCWEWWDSGRATSLEVSLLKSDWAALAREKINPNSDHLRKAGANETTRFLKGLLEPTNPGLKIVVNP
jgi:hypothetical protein